MIYRMWINQPSTNQAHHNLHGERVLAAWEHPATHSDLMRVYFLKGSVVSQQIPFNALSGGWENDE